jgi:tetratricopeptide (TPR) repeat protein
MSGLRRIVLLINPVSRSRLFVSAVMTFLFLGAAALKADEGLKKAIELFEEGKFSEAKALFSSYLSQNQKSAEAALFLGRICIVEDALDDGVDWLKKAVAFDDNNSTNHYWLGIAYGQKAQKAGVLKKPGLAKNMKKEVLRAIELDPNNLDARLVLLQYYLYAPGIMGGSKEKALEQAEEIKARNSLRGYIAFGLIHEHEKAYDLAEKAYLAAVSEEPEKVEYAYQLGYFYQRVERFDEALQTFEKLLDNHPEEKEAYYAIGRMGALSGVHLEKAEGCLMKYLQAIQPEEKANMARGHYRLGMVYEKEGNKDLARREYQVALSFNPKYEEVMKALKKLK